ncbi:hypothetical protein ACTA71_012021 [Dictyostelium dimigraforme]
MNYNFLILLLKYYFVVWFITFVFKYGKRFFTTDDHSKYSYKNLLFKIDFVISLIPLVSSVYYLLASYQNIILFITIIKEKDFQFPDTLWVLFPIFYQMASIFFQYYRFQTIKRNSIKMNVYKEINGKEQLYYENVHLYSYGSEFNKIKFTILTLLWVIVFNLEMMDYINCNQINKYNKLAPGSINFCGDYIHSTEGTNFEIISIITQILPYIFLIPIMELSMVV